MKAEWCNNESIFVENGGPSICFLETFSGGILNAIFLVLIFGRISTLLNYASLNFIQEETKFLMKLLQGLAGSEALLVVLLGLQLNTTGSTIFFIISETITWISIIMLISLEVWKRYQWPSTLVKSYFFFNMFNHIVMLSILMHDDVDSIAYVLSVIIPVINIILLCISVLKVYYYNEEDDEVRQSSVDFLNSNPLSRNVEEPASFFEKLRNFFLERRNTLGYELPLEQPLRESESGWGFWSPKKSSQLNSRMSRENEEDEVVDLVAIHGVEHRTSGDYFEAEYDEGRSYWWWSKPKAPPRPLRSAIERNLSGEDSGSSTPKKKKKKFLSSIWKKPEASEPDSTDEEEFIRQHEESFLTTRNSGQFDRTISTVTTDSVVSVPSSALQKIMDQHKAKVSASNPILEPRGSIHVFNDSKRSKSQGTTTDGKYSSEQSAIVFQVTVQKWGIRSKKGSFYPGTPTGDKMKIVSNALNDFGITNDSNSSIDQSTEIEFEIIINVRRNTDIDFSDQDWSASRGMLQKSTHNRWTVWRTTAELIRLYTAMFGLLGDLAPRRPKLKAEKKLNGAEYAHAESISDMRTISIFLNALLRNKHSQHIKPLEEFLELDKAQLLKQSIPNHPKDGSKELGFRIDTYDNNNINTASITADGTFSLRTAADDSITENDGAVTAADGKTPTKLQDKWRKLFFNMRIKLKPKDIAVRCRLFEGVISGSDICTWLIRSPDTDTSGHQYQHANNRTDACIIAQELVICKFLCTVCSGFIDSENDELYDVHTDGDGEREKEKKSSDWFLRFNDIPGYIYRFPIKSDTAGSFSLFGATVVIRIPVMTYADESESAKTTRDSTMTTVEMTTMNETSRETFSSATTGGGGGGDASSNAGIHIKYIIDISHGGDVWQTSRRYREFEQFHKNLLKEGIKPDAQLPPKSLRNAFARPVGLGRQPLLDDSRRLGLENYLSRAVQAVIDSENEKAMLMMALFLDDDFNNLRMAPNTNTN